MTTTVYVADYTGTQNFLQIGATGSLTDYNIPPGASGTWAYVAERYGYGRISSSFTPSGGLSSVNLDFTKDDSITQYTQATVAAYTVLNSYDQIYDYVAYMRTQAPQNYLATAANGTITFNCNLVLTTSGSTVFNYSNGTLTLLVSPTVAQGSTNTILSTTGAITKSGVTIAGVYSSSAGTSTILTYNNLTNSTIYLVDNTGVQADLQIGKTGTYNEYLAPGSTGVYTWAAEQYGYVRQSGSIDVSLGGKFTQVAGWSTLDTNITVTTEATVAAYTTISTVDQFYDYAAYMRTQQPQYVLVSATGGTLYLTCNLVFNSAASSMWSYNASTNTLTVNSATVLATGLNNSTINTTGTITTTGTQLTCLYVDSQGNSARLNYGGLDSSTVYLSDNTNSQQDLVFNKTGAYIEYILPTATGTWNWVVERFGYNRQTSGVQWTGGGDFSAIINYSQDTNISVTNMTTVAAYSVLDTVDKLYDYAAYKRTLSPQYNLISASGGIARLSCNLVIDKNATSVWNYDSVSNTLTIKATNLAKGSTLTTVSTAGTITLNNSATIDALYIDSSGSSTDLNFTNLLNTTVLVMDNTGAVFDSQINLTGTDTVALEPTVTGNWNWYAERYGYNRQGALFTPVGGNVSAALSYLVDTNITVTTEATVAAYTTISTVDQFYDYAAYMRTQQPQYVLVSASGVSAVATCAIVVDKNAASIWNYNNTTNILTIKSTTLASGVNNTTISSSGTITTANGAKITALYGDSSGNSDRLNFTNLTNATIYVTDYNNALFDLQIGLNSNYTDYINQSQAQGTWNWVVERYGYYRQNGSFLALNAGDVTPAISWIIDQSISQTVEATVAAYTTIDTLDELYDYAAYMRTQQPQYVIMSKVGTNVLFGATTLVLDANASSIWSYNANSQILTVKCNNLTVGDKFQGLSLSGNLSFSNGATTSVIYNSSNGSSSKLAFTGLNSSAIYVYDNNRSQYDYQTGLTGSYTDTFVPGLIGTYGWIATRYGYTTLNGTFSPGTGGTFTASCTWVVDPSITVPNIVTVESYTALDTAQKVYDYAAYYQTLLAGIPIGYSVSISQNSLNFGSYNITIDPNASSVYSISGNTVTIKAATLTANIVTTGLVTYSNGATVNGIVNDSTGYTTELNVTGLTGCSVAVLNAPYTIYDFKQNQTGTYTLNIPSNETGIWSVIITKFGVKPQSFTFALSTGLVSSISYTPVTDSSITVNNLAIVSSYQYLNSTNMMYDYFSYWSTTEVGIPWYDVTYWVGSALSIGNADVTLDPTLPADVAASLTPGTLMVSIKSQILSGDLITTGTVTRSNGAITTGLVTDSTGTTAIITITPLQTGDYYYVEDSNKGSVEYGTVSSGNGYTLYLLPSQQVAGAWKWAAKRLGYTSSYGTFTPAGGGRFTLTPTSTLIKQPDGTNMYLGSSAIGLSVDWTTSGDGTPRILVGNDTYTVQQVYDTAESAMVTQNGMQWLAEGGAIISIATLSAGSFVFLGNYWQFRAAAIGDYSATIGGFALSTTGKTIDGTNGPVSLLSASGLPEDITNDIINTFNMVTEMYANYALEASVQKAIKAPTTAILSLG